MIKAVLVERRMGASLLRLHFHDCFVQGCDGSILLDDVGSFVGEKTAPGNNNSVRGYEVIDQIKRNVELLCPGIVSCADIAASQHGTARCWRSRRSSCARATTALSGAHTIGFSQCANFRDHIYNGTNVDPAFAALRKRTCPAQPPNGDMNLAPFDVQTQLVFDNAYYSNLVAKRGLLNSDQVLFNGGSQDALVRQYVANPALFASDFVTAMIKMGNIKPLTGTAGQIRRNCRVVNS
ncbi:hypothetical protein ZWY2020_015724 [Hordeum vulgare]|nr:hypothetical protein ZWY2020_015724 [Hordeum vulgare]